MRLFFASIFVAASLTAGAPVRAQDWNYSASIYVYAAETKTGIGDRSATLSFSDAVDNLDATFMGAFSAGNGQWGFLIDYMMTDVSFGNATTGPAFGGLNTSVTTRILTGYLSYRLYETDTVSTDLLAGARWFDTDTTLTLLPGTSPGNSRSLSDDWIDPVIGVHSRFSFSDRWAGTVAFDYGGLSDRDTWQVLLTADYAFNANWVGRIGYRHISVSNDERANSYSFKQSGPIFGATYRF
jgi:hypothetical protein